VARLVLLELRARLGRMAQLPVRVAVLVVVAQHRRSVGLVVTVVSLLVVVAVADQSVAQVVKVVTVVVDIYSFGEWCDASACHRKRKSRKYN
jgi:hypothetical protein